MGSKNSKKRSEQQLTNMKCAVKILIILVLVYEAMIPSSGHIVHAIGSGPRAFVVFGQGGSFITNNANNGGTSASSLAMPYKIQLDSSGNLYVSDHGNNRVLYYPAGSTTATRVYGQGGSFSIGNANNGGTSANSLNQPTGLVLDSSGDLYVADSSNNRVLYFPSGSTTATRVYGQGGSFSTSNTNNGGISANSLNQPVGLALDGSNNLYVADSNNNRVLFFPANTTTATLVYGQAGNFTTSTANNGSTSASSLSSPSDVVLDGSSNLYVSDTTNNRVLYYLASTTTATRVYGQSGSFSSNVANNGGISAKSLNQPTGLALDGSSNLYILDTTNIRMLYYPSGSTTATRVYGQASSFNSNFANNGGLDATSLLYPQGVVVDSNGNIYLADTNNNRVLKFQTNLIFTIQPSPTVPVNASFSISAGLGDVGSDVAFPDLAGTISLRIQAGSGTSGAILNGTTAVATVNGVATFSNLSINTTGNGYILTASSPGFVSVNANAFIVAGPLLFTYLTSPTFSITLTGAAGTVTSQQTFKVSDTTQSNLGWNVIITSTQFSTTSGNTLPLTATTITAVTAACTVGQVCVPPTNGTTGYPITVPAAPTAPAPVTFYSANAGTGTGDITITTTFSLLVPSGTAPGTYHSTATETLVNSASPIYAVNSGGASAGRFAADGFFSGSSGSYSIGSTISTNGVSNPAPQAVYQSERFGNAFTYTFPNLVPSAHYMVRLHFAEVYWTSVGQRIFNVSINGLQVLTAFDIIAATGGINRAIVEQFTTTANASGQIVIAYTTIVDNAKASGIEIIALAG